MVRMTPFRVSLTHVGILVISNFVVTAPFRNLHDLRTGDPSSFLPKGIVACYICHPQRYNTAGVSGRGTGLFQGVVPWKNPQPSFSFPQVEKCNDLFRRNSIIFLRDGIRQLPKIAPHKIDQKTGQKMRQK